MPQIGFYGDDFTGSVDTLLHLRRTGLDGVLVCAPDVDLPADLDVVGIAGTARSLPTAQIASQVRPALHRLRATGPRVVQFKACSTADSSPAVGSLGRVIELAREVFPGAPVPVVLAQPEYGRYTFFGHHFARDGDEVYRLDRQPTMRSHPVTPITESDLRLHLGAQTTLPIGLLDVRLLGDPGQVAQRLEAAPDAALVCDATCDADLDVIAGALLGGAVTPRFVLGSGGISGALGRALRVPSRLGALPQEAPAAAGPIVLSASRSALTRRQVAHVEHQGWPVLGVFDPGTRRRLGDLHRRGEAVVVEAASAQDATSDRIEAELAALAADCLRRDADTRLVLCGGDTSGNVLRRLGIHQIRVVAQPWGHVPLLAARGPGRPRSVDLVLKGGQMGHAELFEDIRDGTVSVTPSAPEPVDAQRSW